MLQPFNFIPTLYEINYLEIEIKRNLPLIDAERLSRIKQLKDRWSSDEVHQSYRIEFEVKSILEIILFIKYYQTILWLDLSRK